MTTRTGRVTRGLENHRRWVVVVACFVVLVLVRGSVASYGNFIAPVERDLGWTRTTISLTFSVFLVATAVAAPVTGRLIDSYGARRTMTGFVAVVAVALFGLSAITTPVQFYVLYAVIGFCVTALSLTHVSAIVTKWFDRRALLASALAMSGFSVGQLVFNPVAVELILAYDWRFAYRTFGFLALATVPVAFFLVRTPPRASASAEPSAVDQASAEPSAVESAPAETPSLDAVAGTSVSAALRTRTLWILVLSFTICGFTTVGLITTHLVPYLLDVGFSPTVAADGAGVLGGMTVFGLLLAGALGDRYRERTRSLLASVYFLRGLAFLYLVTITTVPELLAFAAVFGLFYFGTVPLHTGLTAERFGKANLTTLLGVQYMGHQLGGATAAFLAGWIFDVNGSYRWAHYLGLGLLVVAAALVLSERLVARRPTVHQPA